MINCIISGEPGAKGDPGQGGEQGKDGPAGDDAIQEVCTGDQVNYTIL